MTGLPIVPSDSLSWQELDDKVFLINEQSRSLIKLQDVGALFWREAISNSDVKIIIQSVLAEYNINSDTAKRDFDIFIRELIENGFIKE